MIACGSASGSVHLMEVSENMTSSAKNDKAILNAVSIDMEVELRLKQCKEVAIHFVISRPPCVMVRCMLLMFVFFRS